MSAMRLAAVSSELARAVDRLPANVMREVALAAARLAGQRTGLPPRLYELLESSRDDAAVRDRVRREAQAESRDLDERQWNLGELFSTGNVDEATYLREFRRARAAAAVAAAANADARTAAFDALYEAIHAVDDIDAVASLVQSIERGNARGS
jgi:hypothetical protein